MCFGTFQLCSGSGAPRSWIMQMGWLLRILKPKRWRKDMSVRVRTVEKLAGKYSTRRCVDARRRGPCTGRHAPFDHVVTAHHAMLRRPAVPRASRRVPAGWLPTGAAAPFSPVQGLTPFPPGLARQDRGQDPLYRARITLGERIQRKLQLKTPGRNPEHGDLLYIEGGQSADRTMALSLQYHPAA